MSTPSDSRAPQQRQPGYPPEQQPGYRPEQQPAQPGYPPEQQAGAQQAQQPAYSPHPGYAQGGQGGQPGYAPHPGQPASPPYGAQPQQPHAGQQPPQGALWPEQSRVPAGSRRGNPAGLVSVILAAVMIVANLVSYFVQAAVIREASMVAMNLTLLVFGIIGAILAIGAIILGAVGVAAKGRPKALAGAGLGAGAFALVSLLMGSILFPIIMSM